MNLLVTGGNGFVGKVLVERLISKNDVSVSLSLRNTSVSTGAIISHCLGGIDSETDWSKALSGVDVVIHLAARVHVMREKSTSVLEEYRKTNSFGTVNLAEQAVKAGVKRFIFLSTVKVCGESTVDGAFFGADSISSNHDPYGLSKYEAEQGLLNVSAKTCMEVVIIRPPLVYGPGVKANFQKMIRLVNMGIPLPFGSIQNKRSLLAVDNLVDLIVFCLNSPRAANTVLLPSDNEDVSTTELLVKLGEALGKPARLIGVPSKLLEYGLILLGKRSLSTRLCGSLQVEGSQCYEQIGWTPPYSMDEALQKTAEAFKEDEKSL